MDKPEYPEEIMAMARKALDDAEAECIKERYVYGFGTGNAKTVLDMHIAAAILSAQSQAYIDAARIAIEGYKCRTCGHVGPVEHSSCESWDIDGATNSEISAAILQRKEEMK